MRYEKYLVPKSVAEDTGNTVQGQTDILNPSARQILKAATELLRREVSEFVVCEGRRSV